MKAVVGWIRRPRVLAVAGLALLLVALRPLAAQRLTSRFFAPHPGPASPPVDPAHPCEEIAFAARDGSRLEGWWLRSTAPGGTRGVALFVHGNGWHLERQWKHAARLTPDGFDVLVFDYRGFGDSEGRVSRSHAREDLVSALAVARERALSAGVPLVVVGQSMGAALTLETLGARPADSGVAAIVADSPFSSWSAIAAWHVAERPAVRAGLGACLSLVLSASGDDPIDVVREGSGVPLLVIGGGADEVTPPHMATELAEAAGCELLLLEGARHPGSRSPEDEDRVHAREIAFLDEALRPRR